MKNNTKNTTLLAFAAGIVAAPVVYYIFSRMNTQTAPTVDDGFAPAPQAKGLFSAYRGDHKPHHRKADHNGKLN